MDRASTFQQIVSILKPYVKNEAALDSISEETSILDDLQVNSARLVDIILALEDEFDIEIDDDAADEVRTLKNAVDVVLSQKSC